MENESIVKKLKEQEASIDWDKALKCTFCREWITINSNGVLEKEELDFKEEYWEKYKDKLKGVGFKDPNSVNLSLTPYEKECIEDLDGVLLVFKIGNEDNPATTKMLNNFAATVTNLATEKTKVLITHHRVGIEKINLPKLKNIENKLLTEQKEEPIVFDDEFL